MPPSPSRSTFNRAMRRGGQAWRKNLPDQRKEIPLHTPCDKSYSGVAQDKLLCPKSFRKRELQVALGLSIISWHRFCSM